MKIIQLHSENIKRIKAVDITPQDSVIVLSGMNGEGKTSVLDSIWLALQYRAASKNNPSPLRAGEDKGNVTVDLGDYIVTRKFTQAGTTLEVKTPDGSKIASPQKLLDGMIGDLSFDPWEFARKNDADQRQMLADVLFTITGGKVDLAAFEIKHKEAFEKRSDANREKKRLATLLTSIRPPTDSDPTEEILVADLTNSISSAVSTKAKIQSLNEKERALRDKILSMEQDLATARNEHVVVVKELEGVPEIPDIEYLQGQLRNIEDSNRRAREVKEWNKVRSALVGVDADIQKLNDTMELVEIEKAEALESSPLPVKGLRVNETGIQVLSDNDQFVPFCQASAAQRLRVSLGIAMAANPTLRVIRIADGSLLDDSSMQIVREMAGEKDFQVWIEYASRNDQDRIGVYIHDGTVA